MVCTGTLKRIVPGKNYGFIRMANGSGDVFLHMSRLTNASCKDMTVGAELTFDIEKDVRSGKTMAVNVRLFDRAAWLKEAKALDHQQRQQLVRQLQVRLVWAWM
ncbi:unnamed protein product [Symbiodinium natans]|uniref:CSD domain-containing protein n=1 Tax=Symbiodinium natans TaxID=878477 RepID=A0A812UV90_9DINO|nr:unnamed protein product [Symbiodinium natans]